LKKELEEWKGKARKIRSEWDSLKAKYSQVEKEHAAMIREIEICQKQRDDCKKENVQGPVL
jgi:chromosome segregation ATPase